MVASLMSACKGHHPGALTLRGKTMLASGVTAACAAAFAVGVSGSMIAGILAAGTMVLFSLGLATLAKKYQ